MTPTDPENWLALLAAAVKKTHAVPCATCRAAVGVGCQVGADEPRTLVGRAHEARIVAALLADPEARAERVEMTAAVAHPIPRPSAPLDSPPRTTTAVLGISVEERVRAALRSLRPDAPAFEVQRALADGGLRLPLSAVIGWLGVLRQTEEPAA
ncbi:hypothetical protein AB3K78_11790 [Leucobacter sp. HNU]|uniref:zinc finger domain-containing protein n=1 Tax=Leucobacter sp. HNU TaxID=3236805 RepID=UPI003A80CAD6